VCSIVARIELSDARVGYRKSRPGPPFIQAGEGTHRAGEGPLKLGGRRRLRGGRSNGVTAAIGIGPASGRRLNAGSRVTPSRALSHWW